MIQFDRLDDKRVLITGAADGIGRALAEAFHAGGAELFLTDIAAGKLAETADALGASHAPCDVSDAAAMEALVDRAWEENGPFDLLCANAGVFAAGSLLEVRREEIDWLFGVNVFGVLHACRPFVRRLRASGRAGHVLMTGSEHSLSNPAYLRSVSCHVYNMTKHAVLSMADCLRAELEPEAIGVSILCPGPVQSGLTENSTTFRPSRLGAAAPVAMASMSETQQQALASLYMPASEAAGIAIEGLRRQLFVIPTHSFIRQDVDARHREIERGFSVLG